MLLAGAVCLGLAAPLGAADTPAKLAKEGQELYRRGRMGDALIKFEEAARTVLPEAGWRRGAARQLLRRRLDGNGAGGGLNGSAAAQWRQLGALSLIDDTEDALRAYMRAADLSPDDPDLQMRLGVLCLRSGRLDAAESAFRAAGAGGRSRFLLGPLGLAVLNNSLPCRDGLARVRARRGDLGGALEVYRELETVGPQQIWTAAVEPLWALERARILERAGRLDEARAEYERFLALWKEANADAPERVEAAKRALALR